MSLALAAVCAIVLVRSRGDSRHSSRFRDTASGRRARSRSTGDHHDVHRTVVVSLRIARQGARHIRRVFQRYLAPSMVERVVENPKLPELGGELRELTVLFCDLRGFTTLSERLGPQTLTRAVNSFLRRPRRRSSNTAARSTSTSAMRSWRSGMRRSISPIIPRWRVAPRCESRKGWQRSTNQWRGSGVPRLEAGIGINTGLCTVGNFGSNRRFDYSAIGDAVNVAARLEGETKTYGMAILLGPETAARVTDFATRPIGSVRCAAVSNRWRSMPSSATRACGAALRSSSVARSACSSARQHRPLLRACANRIGDRHTDPCIRLRQCAPPPGQRVVYYRDAQRGVRTRSRASRKQDRCRHARVSCGKDARAMLCRHSA